MTSKSQITKDAAICGLEIRESVYAVLPTHLQLSGDSLKIFIGPPYSEDNVNNAEQSSYYAAREYR
jgi:hypothetical protein